MAAAAAMMPGGFDRLARPYRWMEYASFGPWLQRARTRFLPQVQHVRHALVLGDGDGRFTAALLRAAPEVQVTAVDGSAAMLQLLKQRCGRHVTTHQAMLPQGLPELLHGQSYDLVATHFFLDCLTTEEVEELALSLRPHVTPDAVWLVSDFAVAQGWMRLPSAAVVGALYRAFRLLTGLRTQRLPHHPVAMTAGEFRLAQRVSSLGGLLIAELWRPIPDRMGDSVR